MSSTGGLVLDLGCLRSLRAVFGTALHAIGNAGTIQRSADNMVADTRQILDTAAADKYNGVLLQIVANSWIEGGNLNQVGQTNSGYFAQG